MTTIHYLMQELGGGSSIAFASQYRALSAEEKVDLREYAEVEMASLGMTIEG